MTGRIEHLAEGVTVHLGDCREVLPTLRSESVDLILTDPPYGNDNHVNDLNKRLNDYRGIDNKPIANDGEDSMRDVLDAMLTHASRLLRKEASACCCFCGGGASTSLCMAR